MMVRVQTKFGRLGADFRPRIVQRRKTVRLAKVCRRKSRQFPPGSKVAGTLRVPSAKLFFLTHPRAKTTGRTARGACLLLYSGFCVLGWYNQGH